MTMATEIEGQKISQLAEKTQLDGQEQIPVAHGGQNYRIGADKLKEYVQPDLSEYAKKTEIPSTTGLLTKTQADGYYQPKGDYALKTEIPDVSGLATKTEVQDKLDTNTYNSDKATFATKTELSAKVGGTGVTAINVVSALPDPQEDGVLYIVTGEEA